MMRYWLATLGAILLANVHAGTRLGWVAFGIGCWNLVSYVTTIERG